MRVGTARPPRSTGSNVEERAHVRAFIEGHPEIDWDTTAPFGGNKTIVAAVNIEIDQFAHFPRHDTLTRHRKFLHHKEGIEYFGLVYGDIGRQAAEQHVLEDCGWVPSAIDYYNGNADTFGDLTEQGKLAIRVRNPNL